MSLHAIFDGADVEGFLHARDLTTGEEISHGADSWVVPASTFKLFVLVELFRQADAGSIDLTERISVPAAGRTAGPTGLSVMRDPVTMSWRDLACSMMVVSDNAATDVVCDRVGLDRVDATMAQLGLMNTSVPLNCGAQFATVYEDLGDADPALGLSEHQAASLRALDPSRSRRTTPRDVTLLLELLLLDRAAASSSCAAMQRILRQQVWPHRLAAGFPEDRWVTGGKTGTFLTWRNEIGFALSGDDRFAIAVFTRASTLNRGGDPAADAAIGLAARWAVDHLLFRRSTR